MQEEEVRRCFAMVTCRLDINSGNRRRSEEKISILRESKLFQSIPVPSSNWIIFRRNCYWSCITQDNELLPKGFTEYIYHVGNASEVNSMIRNGLIPGGKSIKRGRQAVFFTTVSPVGGECGLGEPPLDLTKPRIAPHKNSWKRLQKYCILVQFEARSRERKDCHFTKHGHMQSFSITHNLQLAMIKRYEWKHRMSATNRFA